MHITSVLPFLLVCAATFTSAYPAATASSSPTTTAPSSFIETPDNAGGAEIDAGFICDYSDTVAGAQLAEMAKLKTQNISVPPYLAGYYSAVNSGRTAIGCSIRDEHGPNVPFTPLQEPCDVIDEQHTRMMNLVDRFHRKSIGVAPFLAGFLSATLDGNKAWGCPPFTVKGNATESAGTLAAINDQDQSSG